jgi:hypothetical protein
MEQKSGKKIQPFFFFANFLRGLSFYGADCNSHVLLQWSNHMYIFLQSVISMNRLSYFTYMSTSSSLHSWVLTSINPLYSYSYIPTIYPVYKILQLYSPSPTKNLYPLSLETNFLNPTCLRCDIQLAYWQRINANGGAPNDLFSRKKKQWSYDYIGYGSLITIYGE